MTQKQNKERIPVSASLYEELKENCPPDMSVDQFTEHLLKNAIEHRQLLADSLRDKA